MGEGREATRQGLLGFPRNERPIIVPRVCKGRQTKDQNRASITILRIGKYVNVL